MSRPEPVLHAPQDTELIVPFPFQIKNHVNEVFHEPGTGNSPLFCHVPDNNDGNTGGLGKVHELIRPLTDLSLTSRRTVTIACIHGLYGIDNEKPRLFRLRRF